jgi:hypothetical protein
MRRRHRGIRNRLTYRHRRNRYWCDRARLGWREARRRLHRHLLVERDDEHNAQRRRQVGDPTPQRCA